LQWWHDRRHSEVGEEREGRGRSRRRSRTRRRRMGRRAGMRAGHWVEGAMSAGHAE
jgi:hypothetical protein